jgi:hypothetical protein
VLDGRGIACRNRQEVRRTEVRLRGEPAGVCVRTVGSTEEYAGVGLRVLAPVGGAAVVNGPPPYVQARDRKARKWNGEIDFFIFYRQIKAAPQSAVRLPGRIFWLIGIAHPAHWDHAVFCRAAAEGTGFFPFPDLRHYSDGRRIMRTQNPHRKRSGLLPRKRRMGSLDYSWSPTCSNSATVQRFGRLRRVRISTQYLPSENSPTKTLAEGQRPPPCGFGRGRPEPLVGRQVL